MSSNQSTLRVAYLVGAITDALAIVPMLSPSVAALVWGIEDSSPPFRFAAASAAALMLGWTVLLLWAYQQPLERRAVAGLTILVVVGLALAEVFAVLSTVVPVGRMVPTWVLQVVLVGMFSVGLVRSRTAHHGAA